MKKRVLIFGLIVLLAFMFVGCSNADSASDDTAADEPEQSAVESVAGDGYTWTLSVNGSDITEAAGLETVTQTLQKQDKEGNLKEQECTGFTLQSLLDCAGASECSTITVAASDGYEYELSADVAALSTTMLVLEQDGEAYELPRLAVDGEGSSAWVKEVVSVTAE